MLTGLTWQKTGTSGRILLDFVSMILNLQGIPCLAQDYQILKDDCSLGLKGIQWRQAEFSLCNNYIHHQRDLRIYTRTKGSSPHSNIYCPCVSVLWQHMLTTHPVDFCIFSIQGNLYPPFLYVSFSCKCC